VTTVWKTILVQLSVIVADVNLIRLSNHESGLRGGVGLRYVFSVIIEYHYRFIILRFEISNFSFEIWDLKFEIKFVKNSKRSLMLWAWVTRKKSVKFRFIDSNWLHVSRLYRKVSVAYAYVCLTSHVKWFFPLATECVVCFHLTKTPGIGRINPELVITAPVCTFIEPNVLFKRQAGEISCVTPTEMIT